MAEHEADDAAEWWRTVLGEYPTGVTLITTVDESGKPASMIAGTFTAVSQDPPMVGFLPHANSKTFERIRANGSFSVSVLGSRHEALSRAFGSAREDRFDLAEWTASRDGNPRVADALAWFDCRISAVHEAGDHLVALADVVDYGTGSGRGGLPLLFLRGGYGTFSVPSEAFDVSDLSTKLRMVARLRELIAELAEKHGVGVLLGALAAESVVVLAEAGAGHHATAQGEFGLTFPFAAPVSPVLAAWASEARTKQWLEGARHLVGEVDRPAFARILERVRARGYAVSAGPAMIERFDEVVSRGDADRAQLAQLWQDIQREQEAYEAQSDMSSIQIPIFDENRHAVMEIVVTGLHLIEPSHFGDLLETAFETARASTRLIGGRPPLEWEQSVDAPVMPEGV